MDLSASALFAGLVFSSLGFAGWVWGRKRRSIAKIAVSMLLVGLPCVASDPWIWPLGLALCAALWFVP